MQEPSDPRAEAWAAKNSWFGQDESHDIYSVRNS